MAAVDYRVWFGCRINGVEYERGEIVTLDDTDPEVLEALNFPAAPKIRLLADGGGGASTSDLFLLMGG